MRIGYRCALSAICLVLASGCAARNINLATDQLAAAHIQADETQGVQILFANGEKLVAPFSGVVREVAVNSGPTSLKARWMQSSSVGGFLTPRYTHSRFQCFNFEFVAAPQANYAIEFYEDGSRIAMWIKDMKSGKIVSRGKVSNTSFCDMPVFMGKSA